VKGHKPKGGRERYWQYKVLVKNMLSKIPVESLSHPLGILMGPVAFSCHPGYPCGPVRSGFHPSKIYGSASPNGQSTQRNQQGIIACLEVESVL
jgi:hypothetical protein